MATERTCESFCSSAREVGVSSFSFLFSYDCLHSLEQVLSKLLLRFTRAPFHQRCFLVACPRVCRRAGSSLSPASRLQHAPPWPQPQHKNLDRARVHRHWSTYPSVGVTVVYVLARPARAPRPHLELIKRCPRRNQASAAFPENTLASFEAAIKDGAEGIETGALPPLA